MKITCRSAEFAESLANVEVRIEDSSGNVIRKAYTDESGTWSGDLSDAVHITLRKQGYVSKTYPANTIPDQIRLLENRLIGYSEHLHYYPGDEMTIYVHAPESFGAVLYRHGLEKQAIATWEELKPVSRQVPDSNFVESGLGWTKGIKLSIPADAQPGLYSLHLHSNSQPEFALPLVISTPPDQPRNDLLVLASTNNWISYNIWGGRNRYRNFEDNASDPYLREPGLTTELLAKMGKAAPRPVVDRVKNLLGMPPNEKPWMFKKLSIHRPFSNASLEDSDIYNPFTNHLAGGEWRVLGWLEREGFSYDITTGHELHFNPEILRNYKAIILSTHCEYWSHEMYQSLKQHHQKNGLAIINLSGNSIYRSVEMSKDGSHRCNNIKFENSVEDETRVIGVRFTESDFGTAAPFRVKKPGHWAFKGLSVRKDETFGAESLNRSLPELIHRYDPAKPGIKSGLRGNGASGWETDKLSRTAPRDFIRIAKGCNRWGGADMVVREANHSRGMVFSASSITFGGALLIDPVCSQITKTVLSESLK